MRTKSAALVVVVLAGLVTVVVWQQRTVVRLQQEKALLQKQAAEADELRAKAARLRKLEVDAAELGRLRGEHQELLRLRGQVGVLRQERQRAAGGASGPTRQEVGPAEPESAGRTFVAQVQVNVGDAQTLVAGGWSTSPGKRVLVLVTPQIAAERGAARQITFQAKLVEAPEEVLAALGMDSIKAESTESASHGVLSEEQAQGLVSALERASGVNVLSAPRVTTVDGRPAQVQVVDLNSVPGSEEKAPVGSMIDLTPHWAEDAKSVDLTLRAQLALPREQGR